VHARPGAWHDGAVPTPLTSATHTRRSTFRIAGFAAVGAVAVSGLAGCSGGDDTASLEPPDPLIAQADRARNDAALATAAVAAMPDRSGALNLITAERTAHADALSAEIARLVGVLEDGSAPTTRSLTTSAPPAPVAPPSLDELRARLTESGRTAAALARSLSGYRAGLLGSISAACTTEVGVLLR